MKTNIITHTTCDNKSHKFVAFSPDYDCAMDYLVTLVKQIVENVYTTLIGAQVLEIVEREELTQATIVRIINPHTGYEYEAFHITERDSLVC